jgi:hypothetical protein
MPWYRFVIQQRAFVPNMSMCATLLQCTAIGDLNVSAQQMLACITAKYGENSYSQKNSTAGGTSPKVNEITQQSHQSHQGAICAPASAASFLLFYPSKIEAFSLKASISAFSLAFSSTSLAYSFRMELNAISFSACECERGSRDIVPCELLG